MVEELRRKQLQECMCIYVDLINMIFGIVAFFSSAQGKLNSHPGDHYPPPSLKYKFAKKSPTSQACILQLNLQSRDRPLLPSLYCELQVVPADSPPCNLQLNSHTRYQPLTPSLCSKIAAKCFNEFSSI